MCGKESEVRWIKSHNFLGMTNKLVSPTLGQKHAIATTLCATRDPSCASARDISVGVIRLMYPTQRSLAAPRHQLSIVGLGLAQWVSHLYMPPADSRVIRLC